MGELDYAARQSETAETQLRLPRVIVVSSVLLYREGLAASLSADGRLRVVAITDPKRVASEVLRCTPQAVVFDATGDESLQMARQLKGLDDALILIGFGISNSAAHAIACAEAGLAGFIDENGSIDMLVGTTLSALAGEFSCSPRVTAILCRRLATLANGGGTRPETTKSSLTPREREIASLVSDGLSNKEIALDLRIGPATVKNHVHNILDKLGVRRRAAIAARVAPSAPSLCAFKAHSSGG